MIYAPWSDVSAGASEAKKHWVKSNLKGDRSHRKYVINTNIAALQTVSQKFYHHVVFAPDVWQECTDESGVFCFVFSLFVCIHLYTYAVQNASTDIEISPIKWREKRDQQHLWALLSLFFKSHICFLTSVWTDPWWHNRRSCWPPRSPRGKRCEGGQERWKWRCGSKKTSMRSHSQASLLSKLDRPMAKAWRAHMG